VHFSPIASAGRGIGELRTVLVPNSPIGARLAEIWDLCTPTSPTQPKFVPQRATNDDSDAPGHA
jgi:hypothetical protein